MTKQERHAERQAIKTAKVKAMSQKQREIYEQYRPVAATLDKYKKELKAKATPAEKKFKSVLDFYKVRYKFQKAFYNMEFRCIVDFFIGTGNSNICVEIDGGYHQTQSQQRKDKYRTEWMEKLRGCTVVRFTNEEVLSMPEKCVFDLATTFLSICKIRQSHNHKVMSSIVDVFNKEPTII